MTFNASWTSLDGWQTHSPDFSGGTGSRGDSTTRVSQRLSMALVVGVVGVEGGGDNGCGKSASWRSHPSIYLLQLLQYGLMSPSRSTSQSLCFADR